MEIIKKLSINGSEYPLGSALVVTVTDNVASYTAAQIYAHAQNGEVVLEHNGFVYSLLGSASGYAIFEHFCDDGIILRAEIYPDGQVTFFEKAYATEQLVNDTIDARLGVIENGAY